MQVHVVYIVKKIASFWGARSINRRDMYENERSSYRPTGRPQLILISSIQQRNRIKNDAGIFNK